MFGTASFATRTFGEDADADVAPLPPINAVLQEASLDLVYLIELHPYNPASGAEEPLYLGNRPYITEPDDDPANRVYQPRVAVPPFFEHSVPMTPEDGVRARLALGEVALSNADGFFDEIVRTHAIDGRRLVVRVGAPGFAFDDFLILFDGIASGWRRATDGTVRVALRDIGFRLEQPIQRNLYEGTGGLEGGPELRGKPKPLAFGFCENVRAVLVDAARQIYQVHDGLLWRITSVSDKGARLARGANVSDIEGAEPVPGEFITSNLQGMFRLGDTAQGLVTADVEGSATHNVFVNTTADIALRMLTDYAAFAPQIDGASFTALNTIQPAPVGIFIGPNDDARTAASVLDELFAGIAGWWGPDSMSRIQVGRVDAPFGIGDVALTEVDILDLELLEMPASVEPPNWRRRVAYRQNWTIQATDVLEIVDADRKQFLAEAFSIATHESPATQETFLEATDPAPLPGLFREAGDGKNEAIRLLGLYGVRRRPFRVRSKMKAARVNAGRVIEIRDHRHGLGAGSIARVISRRINCDRNEVDMVVVV